MVIDYGGALGARGGPDEAVELLLNPLVRVTVMRNYWKPEGTLFNETQMGKV